MKKILPLLIVCLCSALSAIDVTEGEWYTGLPEKDGKIKFAGKPEMRVRIRFLPDGTAEYLSEEVKKMIEHTKKRTGMDISFFWKQEGETFILGQKVSGKDGKRMVGEHKFRLSENQTALIPETGFPLFVRKNATLTEAEVKKFHADIEKMFQKSRDNFAKDLKLPENVKLEIPHPEKFMTDKQYWDGPVGSFQQKVLLANKDGAELAENVAISIPSLEKLLSDPAKKKYLMRYLEANPEWHLFLNRQNKLTAWRRFRHPADGEIEASSYYHHILPTSNGKLTGEKWNDWQVGFSIRFEPEKFSKSSRSRNCDQNITCKTVVPCGTAEVILSEQSLIPGRRMTAMALKLLEQEFAALLANPEKWKDLLPADAVRSGKSDLILTDSFQGGIYQGDIICNPGEPGNIYLKAYEITKGTPLSAVRLENNTLCRMGYSDNPAELFTANVNFTIYEGEWNEFYGARFEVWFQPDSGQPERKLVEKNYKIEGWTR